jgi:hypothetical protein
MPRRRRQPPEPPCPTAEKLGEALLDASVAIHVVLREWAGWDDLARTVRASELALRRDVCSVSALAEVVLSPEIHAASRAAAIRTAEHLGAYLASAREHDLAPRRTLRVAAFALDELIEALRDPRVAPAVTTWN